MKHDIEIIYTEVDSGDCELGCVNIGEGVDIKVNGDLIYRKEAFASCLDYSKVYQNEIVEAILKHFNIDSEVKLILESDYYDIYEDDLDGDL